jgi:hypothetical protein
MKFKLEDYVQDKENVKVSFGDLAEGTIEFTLVDVEDKAFLESVMSEPFGQEEFTLADLEALHAFNPLGSQAVYPEEPDFTERMLEQGDCPCCEEEQEDGDQEQGDERGDEQGG